METKVPTLSEIVKSLDVTNELTEQFEKTSTPAEAMQGFANSLDTLRFLQLYLRQQRDCLPINVAQDAQGHCPGSQASAPLGRKGPSKLGTFSLCILRSFFV